MRFYNRIISFTIIIISILLFLRCNYLQLTSDPIEKAEVHGIYVANFGEGREFIQLTKDSTYIHCTRLLCNSFAG